MKHWIQVLDLGEFLEASRTESLWKHWCWRFFLANQLLKLKLLQCTNRSEWLGMVVTHTHLHTCEYTHTHTRTLTHLPPRTYTLIGVRPLALMHTHTHTDLSPPFTETRIGAHKYAFWTRTLAQKWSRLAGRALQIASDCQIEKKYLNSSEVDVWALVGFQLFKYLASQLVFG